MTLLQLISSLKEEYRKQVDALREQLSDFCQLLLKI
jgi:hypothetical protein